MTGQYPQDRLELRHDSEERRGAHSSCSVQDQFMASMESDMSSGRVWAQLFTPPHPHTVS